MNKYRRKIRIVLGIACIIMLFFQFFRITPIGIGVRPVYAQAIQLSCPNNYGPITSFTLRNATTGNILNWACFDDRTGNISIGSVIYVAPQLSGGLDPGTVINSAYAALPSNGGTIELFPKTDNTCYVYTVPILFNTINKYVLFKGTAPSNSLFCGGSSLNYTPQFGNAITLDYSPATANFGQHTTFHGIDGISLTNNNCITGGGCGGTANGIVVGNVNGGAQLASISHTRSSGFGGAALLLNGGSSNNSWGYVVSESSLIFSSTGASIPAAIESTKFENTRFIADATALNNAGSGDVYINGGSFDGETGSSIICTAGSIHSWFVHYEATVGGAGNDSFITATSCYLDIYGGFMQSDYTTSTTAQFITLNANASLVFRGVTVGTGGRTITNLVTNAASSAAAILDLLNATNITGYCSVPAQCLVITMRGGIIPTTLLGSPLNTNPLSLVMNRNSNQGDSVGLNFSGADTTPLASWNMFRDANNSAFDLQANVTGFGGGLVSALTIQGSLTSAGTRILGSRYYANQGTAEVAGQYVLSAGWGTTASVGSVTGFDQDSTITITSNGTGQAANPTITFTFKDGTWTTIPGCLAVQIGGTGAIADLTTTTESATAPIFTWNGTPVAASTYRITIKCGGR